MKAGRDLDALIAEKVMKWVCTFDDKVHDAWGNLADDLTCANFGKFCRFHLPHYSTDISDAWEVIEKLAASNAIYIEKGVSMHQFTVWIIPGKSRGDGFHVVEDILEKHGGSSCSVPHAICLAALKAVEK